MKTSAILILSAAVFFAIIFIPIIILRWVLRINIIVDLLENIVELLEPDNKKNDDAPPD